MRVQVFQKYVTEKRWLAIRAKPKEELKAALLRLPGVEPDDLIDVFGFKRPIAEGPSFFACTARVKQDAAGKFQSASGHDGVLCKLFTSTGPVQWLKPEDAEPGHCFLQRVYQQSITEACPGLAFSSSGSLGLRRQC
eukprot:5985032-Lingulodinium_polyedra.AAC.1